MNRSSNRQAIMLELRHRLRYSTSEEERASIRSSLEFWRTYNPNQP